MTTTATSSHQRDMPKSVWVKLTGLRGICAFYVLISHIWFQVWPAAEPPLGYGIHPDGVLYWLTGWLYHGHYAVIAFIVVSGYSLQIARIGRGDRYTTAGFLKRRCRRILPPYYAAMALSAFVGLTVARTATGSQWDISIPVTWNSLVTHALLLQDLFDYTKINYAHWSIAAEFHLYLMFPFFIWLVGRVGDRRGTGIVTLVVVGLIACVMLTSDAPAYFFGLILYFFLGMVAANVAAGVSYRTEAFRRRQLLVASGGILAFVIVLSVALGFEVVELILPVFDLAVAIGICLLILGFLPSDVRSASNTTPDALSEWVSGRLEDLGKFSYSLYLIHAPIVAIAWLCLGGNELSKPVMFPLLLAVAIPVALIVSYVFYRIFERPFTR
ncbi:acyltransferase family protein [Nocardia sp. FBN12]|uniref:acyltransferase family protein n=1 Tax=Nocardia sp. FBN12 TaxID=3419766 RepID=UPI003D03F3F6